LKIVADNRVSEAAMNGIVAAVRGLQRAAGESQEETEEPSRGYEVAPASPYWVRGPAHIDPDSVEIVLDEGRASTDYAGDGEDLLFDLAGLGNGDKAQNAVAFVRRYGLLWHGPEDLGSGECRESLEDWFYAVGTLQFTMALYKSFRDHPGTGDPIHALGLELALPEEIANQATEEDYLATAGTVVADLITRGLEGCRPAVGFELQRRDREHIPGGFQFAFVPSNLLAAAYAELAMLVGTHAEIKECPGCGRLFTPESGKQKYHSKSCASTSRWRRWKESQDGS
jgi:hypothetical protein